MWLLIREKDNTVQGTNYLCAPPAPRGFRVVEWFGVEPPVHEPNDGIKSLDPSMGLAPDDPRIVSEASRMLAVIEGLEKRIAELEKIAGGKTDGR